ncbi:hypothetical protein HanPI659440_Chr02g0080931 [Helianthus annuus]|nr:hypothetical protein HanPI659440_Chr02g0080931 [Helianthus annuus]
MLVTLSIHSSLRYGATKLIIAPKGLSKWKAKFFYVKAVAVTARLHFRNVTDTISTVQLNTPELRETSLASAPASYPFQKKIANRELQILWMMLQANRGRRRSLC